MFRRILVAVALVAACSNVSARKPAIPPTPVAQALPVELIRAQNEIGVQVPETAANVGMQFGLVGALIGSAVQNQQAKNAEARIVPLRNLLVEYRFNEKMEQALRERLPSAGLSPEPQLSVRAMRADAEAGATLDSMPAEALVLVPRVAMDYDFGQLTVYLAADLTKRTAKSNGVVKANSQLFRSYSYSFPMHVGIPAQRDAKWVELGGERIAALLDQAAAQLADMVVYDFSAEGRAAWQGKVGNKDFVRVNDVGFAGRPIRQGDDWAWVHVGRGWLTIRGYHPIVASTFAAAAPAAAEAPAAMPDAVPGQAIEPADAAAPAAPAEAADEAGAGA